MRIIFSILLGIHAVGSAQVTVAIQNEIFIQYLEEKISPEKIIALSANKFVLMDKSINELILLEGQQIKGRTGGFGMGSSSFIEPTDMVKHNLQIRVIDHYKNSITYFDYKLNILKEEILITSEYNPFYPDLLAIDPMKGEVVLSKESGVILDVNDQTMPMIDLNQYSISGECVKDLSSNSDGILAILTCHDELILFNRFGRFMERYSVDISEPIIVLDQFNKWIMINEKGAIITDRGSKKQFPINDGEKIIYADSYFQHLIILTNQRIVILE